MTDQLARLHNNPPNQPRDQQPIVMNHLLRPALKIGGTLSMRVEPAQTCSADADELAPSGGITEGPAYSQ
jgi:hypothetical protein